MVFNLLANKPVASMLGNVPKPKASITKAASIEEGVAAAKARVLYTSPQGSQPHRIPRRNDLDAVSAGSRGLVNGCNRFHRLWPIFSIIVILRDQSAI